MEHLNDHKDFSIRRPSWPEVLWLIMFWLGIAIALVWAILKAIGYLHSPPWQEALPVFAVILTLIGGAFIFGRMMGDIFRTLAYIKIDMRTLKVDVKELRADFDAHMARYHTRRA